MTICKPDFVQYANPLMDLDMSQQVTVEGGEDCSEVAHFAQKCEEFYKLLGGIFVGVANLDDSDTVASDDADYLDAVAAAADAAANAALTGGKT